MKQPKYQKEYTKEELMKDLEEKCIANDVEEPVKTPLVKKYILVLVFFLIIALAVLGFILFDKFSKGIAKEPGKLIFDESVTAEEKTYIEDRFNKWKEYGNGAELEHDVTISAETTYTSEGLKQPGTEIPYDIELPTVDFYSRELNVTMDEAKDESENSKIKWISLTEITPENRVVSIDDNYWFDTLDKGAKYRIIHLKSEDNTTALIVSTFATKFTFDAIDDDDDPETTSSLGAYFPIDKKEYLSFAQTGVTALVRAMTNTLNGKAGGRGSYFADNIKDFLSTKDLTHISNEASFADGCKGGTNTMMLCSDWRVLDSITAIGTDIVELTGNHNNNYGTNANIKTIEKYHELGIKTFGGGINAEEAAKPLELNEKDVNITLLGYNKSTSTVGNGELANGNTPGANGYDEAKAKADITAAKERGDFIIVDIQFSECYSYPDGYTEMPECDAPISGQKSFFRQFIDWGADIVIGTQAHHPQTFEYYKGKPIYYGLGNLFFDQTYWPGTQRGYILTHYFDTTTKRYLNTRISPTWYDKNHQVYLMNEKDSESFIERLVKSSAKGN